MKPLPLLREHPRSVQVVLAIVVPALFGGLTGYFLGVSESVYLILSVIGIVGAVGAGFDHLGARAGAARGIVAGSTFGASILIAHEIHGAEAKAHLPEPAILLIVVTTALAVAFAALGGRLRERVEEREHGAQGRAPRAEPVAKGPPIAPGAAERPAGSVGTGAEVAATVSQTAGEPGGAQTPASANADGRVCLNSGSFEEYRSLGMSVTQAKRVIAYREHLGGYTSVDDLDRVPGFPKAFLAELKQELAT